MLHLAEVSARYETPRATVHAVSDITLTINENEIFGLAGESGCGKSSLLKIMYGNIRPPLRVVHGMVTLGQTGGPDGGETFQNAGIRKSWWKTISYVPQGAMSVLNPVARIESQFMDAVPKTNHQSKADITAQITSYLRDLGLPPQVLRSYPHQLSGGMQQRVVIAMATFLHPQIVLADEPTTALDVVVQRGILTLLTRLQETMKNSLVIVSHDMGVHYQITHRMGIMYAGRLVELGPTDRIFDRPLHPYTAALIKSLPKIGDASRREGIAGRPPALTERAVGCPFADRCPRVMDVCRTVAPRLVEFEPGHFVECHLYG